MSARYVHYETDCSYSVLEISSFVCRYREIVASGGQRAMDGLVDIVACIRADVALQVVCLTMNVATFEKVRA